MQEILYGVLFQLALLHTVIQDQVFENNKCNSDIFFLNYVYLNI